MNIEGENNLRIFKIVMMISAAVAFIMLSVLISAKLYPVMNELAASPQKMMELKSWIESYGMWGSMILMAVQVLQVIVSVVPGGPVQILFGMIYRNLERADFQPRRDVRRIDDRVFSHKDLQVQVHNPVHKQGKA